MMLYNCNCIKQLKYNIFIFYIGIPYTTGTTSGVVEALFLSAFGRICPDICGDIVYDGNNSIGCVMDGNTNDGCIIDGNKNIEEVKESIMDVIHQEISKKYIAK